MIMAKLSKKSALKIATLFNGVDLANRVINKKFELPAPLSDADMSAVDDACELREYYECKLFHDFGIAVVGSPFYDEQQKQQREREQQKIAKSQIKSRPSRKTRKTVTMADGAVFGVI